MTSTHKVEVVPVTLTPHPNADTLSIVSVWGYSVCVRTADWKDGDLGAYVVPDSVVPLDRPEFSFLDKPRVRVKRLRGVLSQGLLIPAPRGTLAGDDVAELLGVTRYEPPLPKGSTSGDGVPAPPMAPPVYEIESLRRYPNAIPDGTLVYVTEKIHGANARYTFADGKMYAGTRTRWVDPYGPTIWADAIRRTGWIEPWCRSHPEWTLYGEVYGQVQDLTYGRTDRYFAAFDIRMQDGRWVDAENLHASDYAENGLPIHRAPLICVTEYSASVAAHAEGPSLVFGANHIREGVVVRPARELPYHPEVGRVILKCVGNGYLERAK